MPNPPVIIRNGPVLTDQMVLNLSKRLNKTLDLVNLATVGLRVPDHIVFRYITQSQPYITMAALQVLKHWVKSQRNPYVAYTGMCEALTAAGMSHYVYEVLEVHSQWRIQDFP